MATLTDDVSGIALVGSPLDGLIGRPQIRPFRTWGEYDKMTDDCCLRNYEIYRECTGIAGKAFPELKALPFDWVHNPRCSKMCRDWERFLTVKPLHLKHPLSANPSVEYAFTLTMPPGYDPPKPIEDVARLIMEHGITNKPYEKAAEWAFVKEHTEAGTPHIHGVYKTPSGRRIASKYFMRYWPLWDEKTKLGQGHKGGYHAPARHTESYHAYLQKEGVVVKNSSATV